MHFQTNCGLNAHFKQFWIERIFQRNVDWVHFQNKFRIERILKEIADWEHYQNNYGLSAHLKQLWMACTFRAIADWAHLQSNCGLSTVLDLERKMRHVGSWHEVESMWPRLQLHYTESNSAGYVTYFLLCDKRQPTVLVYFLRLLKCSKFMVKTFATSSLATTRMHAENSGMLNMCTPRSFKPSRNLPYFQLPSPTITNIRGTFCTAKLRKACQKMERVWISTLTLWVPNSRVWRFAIPFFTPK